MQPVSSAQLVVIVLTLVVTVDVVRRLVRVRLGGKRLPLPLGPTQIPILGNILSIDRKQPWKTYTDWHGIYGDIFYLRLLDQATVILGSQAVAVELLEKRSKVYSDRPFVATMEPYGIDCVFAFAPYGDYWKLCRRIVHQTYRADGALAHHPMQLRKACQLIINMVENPDSYEHNCAIFSTSVSLSASYGYEVDTQDDSLVQLFEDFTAAAVPAATPEQAILLKLFPFLLHIPDWFPGSSVKREARRTRDLSKRLTELPYQYAEERMTAHVQHTTLPMVPYHIARMHGYTDPSQRAEFVFSLKKAGVSTILAGAETTASSLMIFILAMVLNPRVWKRAQAEIDAIVGTDRLPDFGDRCALPYVDAIVRETLRWWPVVPLGVWHATSESDIYKDLYIPKGATVVANAWAMSRDKARFPNAEDFIPERFLDDEGKLNQNDPMDFVFGFGRRICPGRYTADASLFASIATMLATLEISPPKDAQGNDLAFRVEWVNGVTHHPKSFPCRISPRAHANKSYLERMLAKLS